MDEPGCCSGGVGIRIYAGKIVTETLQKRSTVVKYLSGGFDCDRTEVHPVLFFKCISPLG